MEADISVLQAFVAKKSDVSDAIKRLRLLTNEVYDEIMPSKSSMEVKIHGII